VECKEYRREFAYFFLNLGRSFALFAFFTKVKDMSFNKRRNIKEQELNAHNLCKFCKKEGSTCAVCKDNRIVVRNSCVNIGGNYIANSIESSIEPTRENLWNPEKFYDAMNEKPARIVIPDVPIKASFPGLPAKGLSNSSRSLRSFQYKTPVISTGRRLPPNAKSPGRYNSRPQNGDTDAAFRKRKYTPSDKIVIDDEEVDCDILPAEADSDIPSEEVDFDILPAKADSDILSEEADIDTMPVRVPDVEIARETEADFDIFPVESIIREKGQQQYQDYEPFDAFALPNERNWRQKHTTAERRLAPEVNQTKKKRVVYIELEKDETLDDISIEFRRKD